eukprot:9097261-Pyramimonas_sp.AAC.1
MLASPNSSGRPSIGSPGLFLPRSCLVCPPSAADAGPASCARCSSGEPAPAGVPAASCRPPWSPG